MNTRLFPDRRIPHRLIAYRPPRIAQLMLLSAILLHWATPLREIRLPALPWPGLAIGSAGCLLVLRAWWLFRRADTAICPTAATSTLITGDVYRLSRNPMYLGMIAMLLGIALGMGTLPFFAATIAYFLVIDRVFIPYEEGKMLREFGDAYRLYLGQARRWL